MRRAILPISLCLLVLRRLLIGDIERDRYHEEAFRRIDSEVKKWVDGEMGTLIFKVPTIFVCLSDCENYYLSFSYRF